MAEQYWDDILYPSFRATIRGEYYGLISRDDMDEECYNLAKRAISAFKFPKISTNYTTFYAIRVNKEKYEETGELIHDETSEQIVEIDENHEYAIPHACFNNELSYDEIEIILAWMKVYWCENQLSNADNFEDMYTDANIKTYSRANAVDKNLKLLTTYRNYARDLENRYSRVTAARKPSLGDINSDE